MTTFQTPEHITLSVELPSGAATVTALPSATTTEVELTPARLGDTDAEELIAQSRVELSGDTVVVHVPSLKGRSFLRRTPEILVTATIPVGSDLVAKLKSADLTVDGELGDARVETASGDVTLADVAGDLKVASASGGLRTDTLGGSVEIQSASGDVRLTTVCGDCRVQTASGDIDLDTVEGELTVRSASGDVTVREAGLSVNAEAASGDVRLARVASGKVEVRTASGDVSVGVQRGVVVWTDVSTLSGDVRSTFEETEPDGDTSGSLELRVHTMSGDIDLQTA